MKTPYHHLQPARGGWRVYGASAVFAARCGNCARGPHPAKKIHRILCIALSLIIAASCWIAGGINVFAAQYQHYYATALRDFMSSANGKTKAVLYDLDGDGVAEAILFDEGAPVGDTDHWAVLAEGGKIAVLGVKNNAGIYSSLEPYEYGHKMYQLIVTNKRYLVLIDIFEGTCYDVYKYENGVLDEVAYLFNGSDADEQCYEINSIECSFEQYRSKLSEYGINNTEKYGFGSGDAAVVVGYGDTIYEWRSFTPAPKDDVGAILAMTSDVEIKPPENGSPGVTAQPVTEPATQAPPVTTTEPAKDPADILTTQPAAPQTALTAKPTEFPVYINGKLIQFDAYLINDNNYFKLRDLAYIMSGTEKQFEVLFSSGNNAILLTSGIAYTAIGGEMAGKGSGVKTPVESKQIVFLNGIEVQFAAYNIDGYNYFKLRDIGSTFNFGVDWDDDLRTVSIDTSKMYVE